MVFCAAGLLVLLVIWPKYVKRQSRLELQYHAGQEITRRRAEGAAESREPGTEGATPPPAEGEPLISLWPLSAVLLMLLVVSAVMFRRGRRPQSLPTRQSSTGESP
jgi:hypothetical protein